MAGDSACNRGISLNGDCDVWPTSLAASRSAGHRGPFQWLCDAGLLELCNCDRDVRQADRLAWIDTNNQLSAPSWRRSICLASPNLDDDGTPARATREVGDDWPNASRIRARLRLHVLGSRT